MIVIRKEKTLDKILQGDSMDNIKKIVQDSSLIKCAGVLDGLNTLVNNPSYQAIKTTADSFAASLENSPLSVIQRELQQKQDMWDSCLKGCAVGLQAVAPVLDNYNKVAELTIVSKKMAEILQPLSTSSIGLQDLTPMTSALSQLADLSNLVMNKPSLLTHLHSAIATQIDTSLWDYWDSVEEISENDIEDAMSEEIVAIVSEDNKESLIEQFIVRYGERGKKILVSVLKWLILTFIGGLVTFCAEPVYKMIVPSVLRQEQSIDAIQTEEIPINTEIHVWGDVTNNFIEISYSIDDREYQGYISREELENNSQKISNEIDWKHVLFINEVVEVLAQNWNIDCETVYRFLKDDTCILNDYILEHYDVLCSIEKDDLVRALEQYCIEEGITVPKVNKEQ